MNTTQERTAACPATETPARGARRARARTRLPQRRQRAGLRAQQPPQQRQRAQLRRPRARRAGWPAAHRRERRRVRRRVRGRVRAGRRRRGRARGALQECGRLLGRPGGGSRGRCCERSESVQDGRSDVARQPGGHTALVRVCAGQRRAEQGDRDPEESSDVLCASGPSTQCTDALQAAGCSARRQGPPRMEAPAVLHASPQSEGRRHPHVLPLRLGRRMPRALSSPSGGASSCLAAPAPGRPAARLSRCPSDARRAAAGGLRSSQSASTPKSAASSWRACAAGRTRSGGGSAAAPADGGASSASAPAARARASASPCARGGVHRGGVDQAVRCHGDA